MAEPEGMDARKAASLVKTHFVHLYGYIADISFRLASVEKNGAEDTWVVKCEFVTPGNPAKPTKYEVKINIKSGQVVQINEI